MFFMDSVLFIFKFLFTLLMWIENKHIKKLLYSTGFKKILFWRRCFSLQTILRKQNFVLVDSWKDQLNKIGFYNRNGFDIGF